MNILHIVPSYKPAYIYGGTITAVAGLCESQARLGHHIMVYTTTANGSDELDIPPRQVQLIDGVKVLYFKRLTKDHTHFSPSLLAMLWRTVKEVDAVHIHSWWNFVTMPAVFICWWRGVQPFFSPHGMLSAYSLENRNTGLKSLFHKTLGRFLLGKTTLHATSQQEANEGKQLIPKWKYILASNIVELPLLKDYQTIPPTASLFRLVFLSRIHPKKGLELLFEALAQLDFPFLFQIAGKGEDSYEATLKKLAQELNIAHAIEWVGWLDGDEKYELLANADLFVLPSYNENFAMVVIEALAVGTPVLLSDRVGLCDYVAQQQLGWICKLDTLAIAHQLRIIQQEQEQRQRIRQLAPIQIHEDFSSEAIAKLYLEKYALS